jgi:hypothetical protein
MNIKKIIALLIIFLFLLSCGSSPPLKYNNKIIKLQGKVIEKLFILKLKLPTQKSRNIRRSNKSGK